MFLLGVSLICTYTCISNHAFNNIIGIYLNHIQIPELPQLLLVSGFNLIKRYESNWIISPGRSENKKNLKPPPSNGNLRYPPQAGFENFLLPSYIGIISPFQFTGLPLLPRLYDNLLLPNLDLKSMAHFK